MPKATNDDTPDLLSLHRQLLDQQALLDRLDAQLGTLDDQTELDIQIQVAADEWWAIADRITATPATTQDGLRVKAEALRLAMQRIILGADETLDAIATGRAGDPHERLALALAHDILAMEKAGEADGWPIGELELPITSLRYTIGILRHMISSPDEVSRNEWSTVATSLDDYANQIEKLWKAAFARHVADKRAHEEVLAAAKKEKAAPGSPQDVASARSMWRMVRTAMTSCVKICDEAEATHAEAQSCP